MWEMIKKMESIKETKIWTCLFPHWCPYQGHQDGYQVCFKDGKCKKQGKVIKIYQIDVEIW